MAITVATLLQRVALDLHEPPAIFPPGRNNLWTLDEMLAYINYTERDFLRQTGILKTDTVVAVAPGTVILFAKPAGLMDIERISFNYKRLRRVTMWDLQREDPTWRSHPNDSPQQYHEDHLPVNAFELDNRPSQGGNMRIFADTLPTEHVAIGENLVVPDAWEQYIRWGVLSLALAKDGDNQDMGRANYAYQRYTIGVTLAKRMVMGTAAVFEAKNA